MPPDSQVILQVPTWFAMAYALAFFAIMGFGVIGIWIVAVRMGGLQKSVDGVSKAQAAHHAEDAARFAGVEGRLDAHGEKITEVRTLLRLTDEVVQAELNDKERRR